MAIDQSKYTKVQRWTMQLLSVCMIVAMAPFVNRYLPLIQVDNYYVDLMVSVILCMIGIWFISYVFKPGIYLAAFIFLGLLCYNEWRGNYGFQNILIDYKGLYQGNLGVKNTKQLDILSFYPRKVESYVDKTVRGIRGKINSQDSTVRNFAVQASLQYFDEYWPKYGKVVRYLSFFRTVRSEFKYVYDSQRDEYFATPMETIHNGLGGDCDDHSILMVSGLEAIGARARIVLIRGHAYPELYCGDRDAFEIMKQAITVLFPQPRVKEIYYHEMNGVFWINFDYSATHPGGPYLNDQVYALIEP
jgi:hypothetical protein